MAIYLIGRRPLTDIHTHIHHDVMMRISVDASGGAVAVLL
jgi:hypothetical protein